MQPNVISIDQAKARKVADDQPLAGTPDIQQEFDELYTAFAANFAPLTAEKEDWIREAVSASTMRKRLVELETRLLNAGIERLSEDPQADGRALTPIQRMALAWKAEVENGSLEKIYRQMEQADNLFHRALRKLTRLRRTVA